MSWQGYVDNNLVGSGKVSQAAILGLKGGVWATSKDLTLSPEEQKAIIDGFDNNDAIQGSGFRVGGQKFFTIQVSGDLLYGKQGADGVCAVKTKQAVIVAVYKAPLVAGEANKVTEAVAEYLVSVGY